MSATVLSPYFKTRYTFRNLSFLIVKFNAYKMLGSIPVPKRSITYYATLLTCRWALACPGILYFLNKAGKAPTSSFFSSYSETHF